MATFRTDPNTGRTVISEANRVDRPISDFSSSDAARTSNTIPGSKDPRSGGFGPPVLQDPGTGYMTRQEFETVSGMTDTNPYGNDGFFSRVFGIDPNKIDYTNNLGPRGIENVKRQAYDRFLNPFARVDAFDRPTMFADASAGTTRRGVRPGDLTIFGPAVESRPEPFKGIGALLNDTMIGRLANPPRTRIPGYDANILLPDLMEGPAVGGGTEPPGVPYFTSSTNPPLAPDAPSMEDIKAARDARNAVPTTVAEVIAAAPMASEQPVVGATITTNTPRVDSPPVTLPSQSESAPSVVFPEQSSELPIDMLEVLGIREPGDPLPDLVPSGGTSLPAPVYIIPQGGFADPRK